MRILLNEIKKILTLKMLIMVFLVNSIIYFLLIEFYITYFPNGRPWLDIYNVNVEMIDKYGIEFDDDEIEDFKKTYDLQLEEANQYLQSRKEFVDAGIGNYEDFRDYGRENDEQRILRNNVMHEEKVSIFWELQAREGLIEDFDKAFNSYFINSNTKQRLKLNEIKEAGYYQVFSDEVIRNFQEIFFSVTIAILLSIVLVISPVFIKDRVRQVNDLQYTTEKGRHLFKTKVVASLISTIGLITALLIIYVSIYSLNNTEMFFDIPMNMFSSGLSWYDLTFLQYIGLTVFAIYILGFVTALVALSLSSIVPNYISLIGIQVPYLFAIIALGLTYLLNQIISIWIPQWVAPTSYSAIVVVSILFIVLMWKREKKRDIVI